MRTTPCFLRIAPVTLAPGQRSLGRGSNARWSQVWSGLGLLATLAACSGGGDGVGASGFVGAAGGIVDGPSGARVVVPAGALASPIPIAVSQSSAGSPALPGGVTALGAMFAFTPHGTHFAVPATITVPFDPGSVPAGVTPALYKTDATQTSWEVVPAAVVDGSTMVGEVSGFSHAVVASATTILFAPTEKQWEVRDHAWGREATSFDGGTEGAPIDVEIVFGPDPTVVPSDVNGRIRNGWVYSTESGRTFFTQAVAPSREPGSSTRRTGTDSRLTQTFYFEATQDSPSLSFVITELRLETIDYGGQAPGPFVCPWLGASPSPEDAQSCIANMSAADATFTLIASGLGYGAFFYSIGGYVYVQGQHQDWTSDLFMTGGERMLWTEADFTFDPDADGDSSLRHVLLKLAAPKTVDLPISQLRQGDVFLVEVTIETSASNTILGESFVGAFLRDPVQSGGLELTTSGLKQIPPRSDIPRSPSPVPCTTGVNPAAGVLQFSAPDVSAPEGSGSAAVLVERTGGASGPVSVRVETRDGTALAGSDYEALSTVIRFADEQLGPQLVRIALLDDAVPEQNETVNLVLSEVGGCAQLGARSTATLTLLDDDQALPPQPTYTVGGTVSGLRGSGLVLGDLYGAGGVTVAENGAYTLPIAIRDGSPYDVRVETQPWSPIQQCEVTRGVGEIAGANVTDIAVSCSAPPPSGGLDQTFGSNGRVVTNVAFAPGATGSRVGMALQPDGRILLVGGLSLLRLNPDGTLDTNFGTGGQVHVPFDASGSDTAQDVATQADGKIVVAGFTGSGSQQDFALARFNADGTLDSSFGTGGKTRTDFLGSTDRARRVRLQDDGKILVAGFATVVVSPTVASVDFALARYNQDGSLDTTFAADGKARDSVAGAYDLAHGLALQPDGKIILAGSAANDGVSDPDVGLVRYWGDSGQGLPGWKDTTFGPLGTGTAESDLQLATGWEEADDVVVLADRTIVVAGRVTVGVATGGRAFGFVLARCGKDAILCQGLITTFTSESDSARSMLVQHDGKIVVVGQSGSLSTNPDMAIVRYNATATGVDPEFGADGKLTIDFLGGIDGAEAVVQQQDGKLVVGGFARSAGKTLLALARLNP